MSKKKSKIEKEFERELRKKAIAKRKKKIAELEVFTWSPKAYELAQKKYHKEMRDTFKKTEVTDREFNKVFDKIRAQEREDIL